MFAKPSEVQHQKQALASAQVVALPSEVRQQVEVRTSRLCNKGDRERLRSRTQGNSGAG